MSESDPIAGHATAANFRTLRPLTEGWRFAILPPRSSETPGQLPGGLTWRPAVVPGTASASLLAQGASPLDQDDPDTHDYWFHCVFNETSGAGRCFIHFDGLATCAEVWLNGAHILTSENMFVGHRIDVTDLLADRVNHELHVCCRALSSLDLPRRPRARWRAPFVADRSLRWLRTSLMGRMPGIGPELPAVGPWRPVSLIREEGIQLHHLRVQVGVEGTTGLVELTAEAAGRIDGAVLYVGDRAVELDVQPTGGSTRVRGSVRLDEVTLWWPHSHGEPCRYPARLRLVAGGDRFEVELAPIGFRSIRAVADPGDGLVLQVNGQELFLRGCCWTPDGVADARHIEFDLRLMLETLKRAGMNMLRIDGTSAYERDEFFLLCDELGILVWQDFMFARMDYPTDEPMFLRNVTSEAEYQLRRMGHHPCLAVLCGNSEIHQQAAMLGLPAEAMVSRWFDETLPALCGEIRSDVPFWPGSPEGGALPFHTDAGVTHYFGVGAYLLEFGDAEVAEPSFATECLALANYPEPHSLAAPQAGDPVDADSLASRAPRDAGVDWTFLDVTHHYMARLFDCRPQELLEQDPERYLHAARVASGEVMARLLGTWRRRGARCRGALIWRHRDLWMSPGWGLFAADGTPKAPYYYVSRLWQSRALWIADRGLNGLRLFVANDAATAIDGDVSVSFRRYDGTRVASGRGRVVCAPRDVAEIALETLLGTFIDSSHAYGFGPPSFDFVEATLTSAGETLLQDVYHPWGRRLSQVGDTGLCAQFLGGDEGWSIRLSAEKFLRSVALSFPGYRPADNYFHLPPGEARTIRLDAHRPSGGSPHGTVRALNATAALAIGAEASL